MAICALQIPCSCLRFNDPGSMGEIGNMFLFFDGLLVYQLSRIGEKMEGAREPRT